MKKISAKKQKNNVLRRALIILFWLLVWQLVSMLVNNVIMLVGPLDTLKALVALIPTAQFWLSLGRSFLNISLGFLSAFAAGIILGSLAYRFKTVGDFLKPVISLMKSIPVASFVIIALIWIGSRRLSIFIAFMVVLPNIYVNTISGLESTDKNMLEMASVFRVPFWKRARYIYAPALMPYLISGCKTSLGMSWKSGVAAEVIGLPEGSIGEKLYMSKIYLETPDLFAWTTVIIVASSVFEHVFLAILGLIEKRGFKSGTEAE